MAIPMELIDEMRKRTNCSYDEAKKLLEKHNGDILEAIVEFEKTQGGCHNFEHRSFGKKIRNLLRKGFQTRFVIQNKEETIVNLSINFMILAFLAAFHLVIIGLILALIIGYKFKITKQKGSDIDVKQVIYDAANKAKKAVDNMTEKDDEKAKNKADIDYNETTVE
jgi:hypothetical protein